MTYSVSFKFNNDVHTCINNLIVNIFVSLVKIFCSRVKLAVNNETEEAVAVKIINIERTSQAEENVRKEVILSLVSVTLVYIIIHMYYIAENNNNTI